MECSHLVDSAKITTPLMRHAEWQCEVCKSDKNSWMCLFCGMVHCGRFINGHAKAHFEQNAQHTVCMDCENLAAFCYTCDEFVINDTKEKHLEQLRISLQTNPEPTENTTRLRIRKRSYSGDSSSTENRLRKRRKPADKTKQNGKLRVVGLRNLGNTCFMNAVLQSLSNIQQFYYYFTQLPALNDNHSKNGKRSYFTRRFKGGDDILMAEELRKTLISLRQASKGAISPESLFTVIWKVVPRYRGYQQQDAHEFLRYMLDRLHTELLNILPFSAASSSFIGSKGKSSIVTTIFGGVLQNEVNCLFCGTESKKHDPFLDLSLDIPQQYCTKMGGPKLKEDDQIPSCKLSDCLNSFTELEELADTELYYCNNCKKKQRSTKKFWIRRLPNVLCLHLKRFRWSNYFRIKIDNYVEFPLKGLDMSKFVLANMHETRGNCSGSHLYDLAAVIVHHGSGAGSGHYTAYATHEGSWYHFNDSTVTRSDEQTVAKCKAYIFFYIRREFKLPAVGT